MWDMGGQTVYYPTHQFFLSSGAIYLLLFNLELPRFTRIEYWLKQARLFHSTRVLKLILVGTHCDSVPPERLSSVTSKVMERFPSRVYPLVSQEIMLVDCKTGTGLADLKRLLLKIGHREQIQQVPEAWVQLHEMVIQNRQGGNKYTEWATYSAWAKMCGVPSEDLQVATNHLHMSGTLIHHPSKMQHDLVVISPQWLSDVMACLITIRPTFVEHGYVTIDNLAITFANFPEEIHENLLELLQRFNIIFPLMSGQNRRYMIPSLLTTTFPAKQVMEFFPATLPPGIASFGRVFRYQSLPLGLFGRAMVAVLHLPDVSGLVYWRNGMLFECHLGSDSLCVRSQCLLTYEATTYSLSLYIRFPSSSLALSVKVWRTLLETLRSLVESFYPSLANDMEEFFPCVHCMRASKDFSSIHLFPHRRCTKARSNGDQVVYCQDIISPARAVSVHHLAPDLFLLDLVRLDDSNLEIRRLLGKGSSGVVYRATLNGKEVAVKQPIMIEGLDDPRFFQDFQTESYIMSLLDHPNIVRLYGVMDNPPRMILQYVGGTDLFQLIHPGANENMIGDEIPSIAQDALSWPRRIQIALGIAQGLHHMQSVTPPLVHRDLRSPNIFISEEGQALIGDFGLARQYQGQLAGPLKSWRWLAPEVLRGDGSDLYDERSDIYSFGILLWELASLSIPFFAEEALFEDTLAIKTAIIQADLRPTFPSQTLQGIAEIGLRCWKTDPALRPTSSELVTHLAEMAEKLGELITDSTPPRPDMEFDVLPNKDLDEEVVVEDGVKITHQFQHRDANRRNICSQMVEDSLWVGSTDGKITIYVIDRVLNEVAVQQILEFHQVRVTQLLLIGKAVLSCGEDGVVAVWDCLSPKLLHQWQPFHMGHSILLACSPTDLANSVIWTVCPLTGEAALWEYVSLSDGREYILTIIKDYCFVRGFQHKSLIGRTNLCVYQSYLLAAGCLPSVSVIQEDSTEADSLTGHSSAVLQLLSADEKLFTISQTEMRVWQVLKVKVDSSKRQSPNSSWQCLFSLALTDVPKRIGILRLRSKLAIGTTNGSLWYFLKSPRGYRPEREIELPLQGDADRSVRGIGEDSSLRVWAITSRFVFVITNIAKVHRCQAGDHKASSANDFRRAYPTSNARSLSDTSPLPGKTRATSATGFLGMGLSRSQSVADSDSDSSPK